MTEQINAAKSADEVVVLLVDMRLTVMKEVETKWLVFMYDYLLGHPDICKNGFMKAGIAHAISNPEEIASTPLPDDLEDPFSDLDLRQHLVCSLPCLVYRYSFR